MSQPDHESIVNEIRSSRIAASARAAGARPRDRGDRVRRRLAPPAARAALAAAVARARPRRRRRSRFAAALARRPRRPPGRAARRTRPGAEAAPQPALRHGPGRRATRSRPCSRRPPGRRRRVAGVSGGANLPTTPGRAQLYEAELTLKVQRPLGGDEARAPPDARFNGYVRSVEYGSGTESGTAYLVLRVPVGSVQEAIVSSRRSARSSTSTSRSRTSSRSSTGGSGRCRRMRDQIAKLQAKLESPTLSGRARTALENQLVGARRQLRRPPAGAGRAPAPDELRDRLARPAHGQQGRRRPARAGPDRPRAPPLGLDPRSTRRRCSSTC